MSLPPIAIIGAGLAGLSAALSLTGQGRQVRLFECLPQVGGRLSTWQQDGRQFDHGGQFLTVRDAGMRAVMAGLVADGHAARWDGTIGRLSADGQISPHLVERYVGRPCMRDLAGGLATRLPPSARPQCGRQVMSIRGTPGAWHLHIANGESEGPFSALIVAIPGPQAALLLASPAPALATLAQGAEMAPCWALLLEFAERVPMAWDGAFLAPSGGVEQPLSWIARDGAKPGRAGAASFVAHASPGWSRRYLDESPAAVTAALLPAFRAATGINADPVLIATHCWRYALPTRPLSQGFLWDGSLRIGACGDWCLEARAEAAFVSGARLAAAMSG